jgi:hypothetical protein
MNERALLHSWQNALNVVLAVPQLRHVTTDIEARFDSSG